VALFTVIACIATAAAAIYVEMGLLFALPVVGAALVALVAWSRTSFRHPGTSDRVVVLYIAGIVALMVEHMDQWRSRAPELVMQLASGWAAPGFVFNERILIAVFAIASPALFLLGGFYLVRRQPLGDYIAWLLFAWSLVAGLLSRPDALGVATRARDVRSAVAPRGTRSAEADPVFPCALRDGDAVTPRQRRLWILLIVAFVVTYGTTLYIQAGPAPVGVIVGSMMGGMVGWLKTTSKRPANPRVILPPYLLMLSLFMVHVDEEYLFDFRGRIAAIFHSHWSEHDFVLLIVLVGPMAWILGGIGLWLRHPLGNFIVWFMLVGMILGEPTHLLVFPLLEGGRYHYFPGMWTALFPMIPAVYGVWRILADHRATEPKRA
jgi:hypothetical protein